ncbi:hypothetical protein EV183_001906 [Coemansia sp. RSA 2336]|nr:hypothetical protein EV183_001906 [Coemansia sp. RSA 2336]
MTHREARHASAYEPNSISAQSAYIAAALLCFILEITTKPLQVESPCNCNRVDCMEARERYKPKPHIFSRLIYMWVTPAIDNGRLQNRYREDDLFRVPQDISGQQANIEFLTDWDTFGATNQQSLLFLLAKHTCRGILVSGAYMALSTAAQLLQPWMLKKAIEFFREYGRSDGVAFDEGLMLAMGMGFLGLVRAVAYQAHWHVLMKPYLWLEKVLAALVFRKTLRLSNESRSTHSTGEIASYLGVDVGILATSINYVHFVWEYPLRIVVVLYMLYKTVGYSSLVGVGLLLLNTGISARIARYVQRHTKSYVDSRDQRMQVLTETILNMKGIKLYAWQAAFIGRIDRIRNTLELAALKHVGLWKSLLTLTSSLVTVCIGLTTFAVYVIFDGTSHGQLSSQLIFVSLSLFMLLEEPLSQGPTVVSVLINAARSYSRICKLVTSNELDQNAVIREPYDRDAPGTGSSDVLVKVEDGSFKWLSTQEPTLTNVNLQCRREELVAVIGKVGSGKSSLVSAMLGDMVKCAGQVTIRGRVAYVPQQAWIVNATLRDNILFGNRFNQELYDRVIDACALRQDLEMLPGGDMTEIGEKGINLSGGQKARVSLARAVYSRADVYILDDPLAAVDAHVGKHIFTQVLGPQGMLRTRARILVTNAVQYLSNANHIIMLRDGAVLAEGDPETATKANDRTNGTAFSIMQIESLDVGAVSKDSIKFYLQASGYGNVAVSDLSQVDDNVPTCAELSIKGFIQMAVAILLIIVSAPLALVFVVPLSLVYVNLYKRFMPTTRDTRRMVNSMRNLCIGAAEETIGGASSIRAYSCQSRFENRYAERVENYTMAWWTYLCANRWLAVRLDIISAAILFFTNLALLFVQQGFGTVDGGRVGLSLTYALSLVGVLNVGIRYTSMLELAFISVERACKFSSLSSEAPEIIQDRRPTDEWPEKGMIEFKNYSTRYREGLDLVLKDLSFRVMPNQKVGIVGRTGAGKSSLTLALFRIIEAAGGQILLDGEDISQYGLFDVRSKLSIIPQDPVLFAGTVRENLDPFGHYSDQEVWQALEHAHLADFIRTKDKQLDFMVTQAGENFSVGQRQLICLARALLKKAKVLILDEATAAIDNSTDTIIQESIRKEFKQCTVLTIAHRLNTIIDSDMILVVDGGKLAEYDTPQNLLQNENSLFAKLVEEARASDTQ